MKKILIAFVGLMVLSLNFMGCDTEDGPTTYTIASKQGAYKGWEGYYRDEYFMKVNPDGEWMSVDVLYGMKYELGYEYVVEGRFLTAEEQFKQDMIADAVNEFTVTNVISKEQKDTELPDRYDSSVACYEREFLSKE